MRSPAALASALVAALFSGAAYAVPGVHLSWVRGDAAADCPDAAAIESEVGARLGDDPFRRTPSQFIEATVARQSAGYQVAIAMRGSDGKLIGSRALSSAAGDCRSIATAAALTIAILIDPDAIARAPAPPPPPPPATAVEPPPPPPPAPGRAGRIAALASGNRGSLPGIALGLGLAATLDVGRRWAIGLGGAFFPERRTAAPDDGFGFGLASGEAIGCFIAAGGGAEPAALRWELCAGVSAGLLHAVVYTGNPLDPGERWTFAAAQLTRVVIPLFGGALVELGLAAHEPLPRRSFFVEGRPSGMDTVFTQPALAVTGSVGLGLAWR